MSYLSKIMLGGVVCVAMAGCRTVPPPTPLSQLNAQQMHGHDVFQSRCSVCHYDRRNDPLHGPALVGLFKKQTLPSGAAATDERVTATIEHGRGVMPAMGKTMDEQDLQDLLAYLHTI